MNLDTCPIYSCAKEKNLKHCGECEKLPCEIWMNTKDPTYSEEKFQQGIKARIAVLRGL